jgi:hypothetical protein
VTAIRVVRKSGVSHGTGDARAARIEAWLLTLSPTALANLAHALRQTEREAGDWLEAHGQPRSWRKQMRVE